MVDFTTRLRLEKQDTNTNQNTWGSILNSRVFDMVDEALAGVDTIALTGIDITLSTANGTTDQARNLGLRFTGTGGVTVTCPSVEKVYVVINDSNGNVTMSAGGTTVTIPNGYTQCVATNGTNFYNIGLTKAQMDAAIAAAITPVADAGTVKVTSSDTTGKYLNSALIAGLGVQTTVNNPASNETLSVAIKGVSASTAGQVLTSTGASTDPTFQDLTPSGTKNFTASGAISTGDIVALNSDGTVSVASGSSPTVFESASTDQISSAYDATNQRVVIAYRDGGNSNYGTAVVGTVSGTSISFGTPVVFESANTTFVSATYDATNQKVVIAYTDAGNSNYGTAVVGTVSGTSISFGTPAVFESASTDPISATYDATNGKIVIAYRDIGNSNYGTAVVGTVSGTSISFGTPAVFESAGTNYISATYDATNQKVVIAYQDNGNSNYGTAVVGTVSGTSISFGTPVVFESASATFISSAYDVTNGKIVIAYRDVGNSNYGTATVGTVSGTSISFGTPVVFESASASYFSATYDATNQNVVIAYTDAGNSGYGTAIAVPVIGTEIFVTNVPTWIGIAAENISDAATGSINIIGGINDQQSGLTIGSIYYVSDTGSLTTSTTSYKVGKAIAATEILITEGNA